MSKFAVEMTKVHSIVIVIEAENKEQAQKIGYDANIDLDSEESNRIETSYNIYQVRDSEKVTY